MAGLGTRTGFRRGAVFGVAAGGVLLGHRLTYLLRAPHDVAASPAVDPHGYLWLANELALTVALAGTALIFLNRLTRPGVAAPRTRDTAVGLAGFQIAAFASMEVVERAATGTPMHDLPGLLATGVALQAILAVAGAVLVGWLLRAADHAGAALATAPRLPRPRGAPMRAAQALVRGRFACAPVEIRGPPPAR